MIVGIGVDLVDVARFESKLSATPALIERIFTPEERERSTESLAGVWASKEALVKALGNPVGLSWQDMTVAKDSLGKPRLEVTGATKERSQQMGIESWHLSITHDGGMACAFVIAEGN
ncbi:MAG: Holo-[acyl-carrier-protein] synthase [Actinomycetota bacterium]|jgi:holo-[acyl-carrier protein] synthase